LVYDVNSFRLALDVQSGRVLPEQAMNYTGVKGAQVQAMLRELRQAGRALSEGTEVDVAALNALRKRAAAALRTTYVPMTGDPMISAESEFAQTRSGAPNVAPIRRAEGRDSFPDDGITASMEQLMKSANFAGFQPFQKAVLDRSMGMSKNERNVAGMSVRSIKPGQIGNPGPDGIAYRRPNGSGGVVSFNDPNVMTAIRKGNMDDFS